MLSSKGQGRDVKGAKNALVRAQVWLVTPESKQCHVRRSSQGGDWHPAVNPT